MHQRLLSVLIKIYYKYYKQLHSLLPQSKIQMLEMMTPGKKRKEIEAAYFAAVGSRMLYALLLILFFVPTVYLLGRNGETGAYYLKRNPQGGGDLAYSVEVQDETGDISEEIVLHIQEREYSSEETEAFFAEMFCLLEEGIPGENGDLSYVTGDLLFPSKLPGYNAEVLWYSEAPEIVGHDGQVNNRELSTRQTVRIQAKISCGEAYRTKTYEVTVYPKTLTEKEAKIDEITQALSALEEESVREPIFVLPKQIGEFRIMKQGETKYSLPVYLFVAVGSILAVIYIAEGFMIEKRKKHRDGILRREYAEMVSMLAVYISAGLPVRAAWNRVTLLYEQRKGKTHPVSSELRYSLGELENGEPEVQVYEAFGRRTEQISYQRIGALLSQNVSKGMERLQELIFAEAKEALATEQEVIRTEGAEVSTKLLLPMLVMLAEVFAIILVPAFMTF